MSVYLKNVIIDELIIETNNIYMDCLEQKSSVPSVIQFFNDEYHMRYELNQLLLNGCITETSEVYYINFLLKTFPEGFGYYYLNSLKNNNINLTDIYYQLKTNNIY